MSGKVFRLALLLSILAVVRPAAADIIETFSNGSDNGDWHLTTNPLRSLGIQPSGGNPGAYMRGDVNSATPTWYVPYGTTTNFLGDYYAKGVTGMSADINIFVGNQEPNRTLTLDLQTTLGTGDFSNAIEAYYIGPDISNNQPGWVHYQFSLDARSSVIPTGWTVFRNGLPGNANDWQLLMHDVETFGFVLGQPGFAYTNHTVWDLGLDNPQLIGTTSVPEPGSSALFFTGLGAVLFFNRKRFVRSTINRGGSRCE
jgi:hypothetical protein